ncbi:peptidoglycan DD-metalloendopeptidase family protein [Naumannella halotolerans]|uniref:peptidoglycan DD-metalloendopeptidase family protein n=1 Tax=Naumannella halotolerans TaxID=993414 RepID=UPI00370D475B
MPRRLVRRAATAVAAVALTIGLTAPAFADPSDDADKAEKKLTEAESQLDDSSNDLESARSALADAESQLDDARSELNRIQGELADAQERDEESQERLAEAQEKLEQAKAAVAANQKRVEEQREKAGEVVREQYQKQNSLVGLAMVVDNTTAGTLQTRAQWSTTMFNATQAKLDALEEAQQKLEAAKKAQAEAEAEAEAEREAAATNLSNMQELESEAQAEESRISELVAAKSDAQAEVETQVEADKDRVAEMAAESEEAQEKLEEYEAEQAKKAEEERKEREAKAKKDKEAAEKKKEEEEKKAEEKKEEEKKKAEKEEKKESDSSRDATKTSSAAAVSPIQPGKYRISAVFGQTGLWARYHTGLDFAGVYTGTPIRAAKDGVVLSSTAGGWAGNHVILRHSNGESTLYAHMSRKSASKGKVVKKGDIIGYTGATGNVTGPHLHFEYYPKGATPGSVYSAKDPRAWLKKNGVNI